MTKFNGQREKYISLYFNTTKQEIKEGWPGRRTGGMGRKEGLAERRDGREGRSGFGNEMEVRLSR